MKKYVVKIIQIEEFELEVNSNSEDEAIQLAKNILLDPVEAGSYSVSLEVEEEDAIEVFE